MQQSGFSRTLLVQCGLSLESLLSELSTESDFLSDVATDTLPDVFAREGKGTIMRRYTILILLSLIGLNGGCELETYRTIEGYGVIGPAGGWFVCSDNEDCIGTAHDFIGPTK